MTDGNGRFGEWLGDEKWNEMAHRFWWPRILANDLECLNKSQCYDTTTFQSKSNATSRSLVDIVLINRNWSNNTESSRSTSHASASECTSTWTTTRSRGCR